MPTIKIVPFPGVPGPQGPRGLQGIQGETGLTGPMGPAGDSAYDVAVSNGFEGTEQEWLDSLGVGGTANIADFVFELVPENEDVSARSTMTIANHDMYIQTTKDDGQDSDIEIVSADDIRITSNDLIALRSGSHLTIRTGWDSIAEESNYRWEFDEDGQFNFPGNGYIENQAGSSGDGNGYSTIKLVPDSSLETDQYLILDPTQPNHIHIRAGGIIDESAADLIIGGENTNVKISDQSGSVDILAADININSYSAPSSININTYSGAIVNSARTSNYDPEDRVVATLGDIEIGVANAEPVETPFTVNGGTLGTQPTFTGDPLFSGSYVKHGPMVHFQVQVDMNNITSFGTGQYFVDLPFPAKYGYQVTEGCLHDVSTGKQYAMGGHVYAGESRLALSFTNTNGQDEPFDYNSPVTLTTEDNFHIAGTYITN